MREQDRDDASACERRGDPRDLPDRAALILAPDEYDGIAIRPSAMIVYFETLVVSAARTPRARRSRAPSRTCAGEANARRELRARSRAVVIAFNRTTLVP
jgi:hypothetical protein